MRIAYLKINNIQFNLFILFVLILFLALNQYLFNRSLWIDEAMLGNNILSRSFLELLYPLDDYQVAPPGYLWILKLFSFISKSEYSLRLISLLAFGGALYFFYKILEVLKLSFPVKGLLIALFGFNYHTLYYASELKPYMIDLFAIIYLVYYAILLFNKKNVFGFSLLIFSIVMTYVSYITFLGVIVLFVLFLINEQFKFKKIYLHDRKVIFWFFIYGVSVLVLYIFFIHNHPYKSWMIMFWEPKNAFMPKNLELVFPFIFEKFKEVFFEVINHGKFIGYLMIVFFVISPFVFILKRKIILLLVLLLPVFIHFVMSYFRFYPIASRLIIYWIPLFLLVIGGSLDFFINKIKIFKSELVKKSLSSLVILLVFINFLNRNSLVYKHEEIKTCINYLNDNRINLPSLVYVYYGAKPAFDFYKSINFIKTDYLWFYGNNYRTQPEKYIEEINQFFPPFLILFSHVHGGEMNQLIEYLSQNFEVQLLSQDTGAYLYLVDNFSNAN